MTFTSFENSTPQKFTRSEISQQNGKDGKPIWIIFKNSVYDITNYLDAHPGGKKILLEYAGRDCTKDFIDMGHSNDAMKEMKEMKIGEVCEDKNPQTHQKLQTSESFASIMSTESERKKKRRFLLCR